MKNGIVRKLDRQTRSGNVIHNQMLREPPKLAAGLSDLAALGRMGWDIFHGRHDMDQLFSLRPRPKAAQYRTPVQDLYLCGSGATGYNAARRLIAEFKRR